MAASAPANPGAHSTASTPTKKSFVPLENNPDVMTTMAHRLGLSKKLAFHDVFTIDDHEMLAYCSRPCYALLLVFPCTKTYEDHRRQEDLERQQYGGSGPNEPVMWIKQTIGNACGLIGLLHCVLNGEARSFIEPGSPLDSLYNQALPLRAKERAELIEQSDTLEVAHKTAAAKGDSAAPAADVDVDLHFVCFVKGTDGHLYEMDGRRKSPLDRGGIGGDEDMLSEQALKVGVRNFMERERAQGEDDNRFSMLSLAPAFDD